MPIKRLSSALLAVLLLTVLPGCSRSAAAQDGRLHIVASTYPIYVLSGAVTTGADNVDLSRLNTGQVSCLHDYTLTVADARRLEEADLLLLNGAGLEEFLDSTLERLDTPVVDCSASVSLLEADGHEHHHDDDEKSHEHDPHFWMDPRNAAGMAEAIADGLSVLDPGNGDLYRQNAGQVSQLLLDAYSGWQAELSGCSHPYLITFHDGFRYFADAFDLELLFAMEEEEGSTASAKDIGTASVFVKEYSLSAIFMEANGSGSAARAVSGETGAAVRSLTMLMDGPDLSPGQTAREILTTLYLAPIGQNIQTIAEVLS